MLVSWGHKLAVRFVHTTETVHQQVFLGHPPFRPCIIAKANWDMAEQDSFGAALLQFVRYLSLELMATCEHLLPACV